MTISYKKIISTFLIVILAVLTGFSIGKIYLDQNTAPTGLAALPEDFRATNEEILALYERSLNQSVSEFSGVELWQIAEYKLSIQDKFKREMTGNVNSAGQNLNLRSIKEKKGNLLTYTKLSPSRSVVGITTPKICSKIIYNYTNPNQIEIIKDGNFLNENAPSNELDAVFSDNGEIYSEENYFSIFNATPDESILPFIISEKTCPKDSDIISELTDNDDGTYSFDINLSGQNLNEAALYYSYEILFSGGYSFPAWKSVSIKVTIDENFLFRGIIYHEEYSVFNAPVIGKADVIDDFVDVFTYGDEVTL